MSNLRHRPQQQPSQVRLGEAPNRLSRALAHLVRDLSVWSDVRAFPPLAVLGGLDCVASLVLIRDRFGGPPVRLADARLCIAALAATVLTIGSRWVLARLERQRPVQWIRILVAACSVLPLVALLSTATARNSPWAISFVSALAMAAANANLLWNRRSPMPAAVTLPFPIVAISGPEVESNRQPDADLKTDAKAVDDRRANEWIERTTDTLGQVILHGRTIAEFAAGESLATVHIPFCPPLRTIPQFSCEVIGEPSIRARAPAVYRYGARLELKRSGKDATRARAEVRFQAIVAIDSRRAA